MAEWLRIGDWMKPLPLWLVTALLHGYIAARLLPGLQAFAATVYGWAAQVA
jgi:hypothetical protein